MKLLLMLTLTFMVVYLINVGESKPLFFDAITGAFNELRKLFFGNGIGLNKKIFNYSLQIEYYLSK